MMSSFDSILKKIFKGIKTSFSQDTWYKKAVWLISDYPELVAWQGQDVRIGMVDGVIVRGEFEFLFDGFASLKDLYEHGDFTFSVNRDHVIASGKDLVFSVSTAEELFILREIFLGKHYNFDAGKAVVVVDIGMNVGMASLYFASRKDVVNIYSYEPFVPTYKQGLHNLDRNRLISNKINPYNYGLSDAESELQVEYNFANKGQVGIFGTKLINSRIDEVSTQKIHLKPVMHELQKIVDENPGQDIVLKIDCEGAEYDIFKALHASGIPEQVKLVMMEWHKGDPQWLVSVLANNGFRSVNTSSYAQQVGMIYSCRG